MTYQVFAGVGIKEADYTPYGGCEEFFYCKEPEFIASGPAETGKTLAAMWRMHLMCLKYPNSQHAILRKVQSDVYSTVLQTFERVIEGSPVEPYGGKKPERYDYPNGSIIWVGGMDKPGKVLSGERDSIYVNQAEELSLDAWETLTTRTTGRGAVMPYTMTWGDCNPGGSKHWIRRRQGLKLIQTTHRDNPTLFNPATGEITEQGEKTLSRLGALTGVRRKRLLDGLWATAEGAVYDMFDVSVHVCKRDEAEMKRWYLAVDEGYTNPAVILLVGEDSDKRHHIFKEFYRRGVLQSGVVAAAKEWSDTYHISMAAVDGAANGLIADMRNSGINAIGAKAGVFESIQFVQNRMKIQGDKRPRLTIDPSCENTINDFESYAWKPEKDEPIKENDHAPDAYRYLLIALGDSPSWLIS